ncbi:hypothetical protein J1N35_031803 [Gossypium stocksii]|uniref:Uncharacterized protein n=1 Tax=Gossypium stocksii TaxID=47602 RepID=A0A9D3ZU37_9ROSI|nr:hypothetical protein J1N35_031803 [Gossypium stocksii]
MKIFRLLNHRFIVHQLHKQQMGSRNRMTNQTPKQTSLTMNIISSQKLVGNNYGRGLKPQNTKTNKRTWVLYIPYLNRQKTRVNVGLPLLRNQIESCNLNLKYQVLKSLATRISEETLFYSWGFLDTAFSPGGGVREICREGGLENHETCFSNSRGLGQEPQNRMMIDLTLD